MYSTSIRLCSSNAKPIADHISYFSYAIQRKQNTFKISLLVVIDILVTPIPKNTSKHLSLFIRRKLYFYLELDLKI